MLFPVVNGSNTKRVVVCQIFHGAWRDSAATTFGPAVAGLERMHTEIGCLLLGHRVVKILIRLLNHNLCITGVWQQINTNLEASPIDLAASEN